MKKILLTLMLATTTAHAEPTQNDFAKSGMIVNEEAREIYDNTVRESISEDSKLFGSFEKQDLNCGQDKLPDSVTVDLSYDSHRFDEMGRRTYRLCVFVTSDMSGFPVSDFRYCGNNNSSNTSVEGRDPSTGILWMLPKLNTQKVSSLVSNVKLQTEYSSGSFKKANQIVLNEENQNEILITRAATKNKNLNEAAFNVSCGYKRK